MKCMSCDKGALVMTRENVRDTGSGLPGVTLLGVEVSHCPVCGDREIAIPCIEALHRALALALVGKHARLTPEEVRFLRTYLGWSGRDFARMMGVDPSTVSRWEKDQPMGEIADRLLRAYVLLRRPVDSYPVDQLGDVAVSDPAPLRVTLRSARDGWEHASP